jgi:putative thioredoxin
LEKEVDKLGESVSLVKVNIDENKMIAAQLRVQSIPAVFAFSDGQPVDAFMGEKTESEVKVFLETIVSKFSKAESDPFKTAEKMIDNGEYEQARIILTDMIKKNPSAEAFAMLIKTCTELSNFSEIENILPLVPTNFLGDKKLNQAISSYELIESSRKSENVDELNTIISREPKNLDAKLRLSKSLFREEKFEESIAELLKIFKIDREWNDAIAKKQAIMIFDHLGPENEIAKRGRRALTSLIFN